MDCIKDKISEGIILAGRFETISPLNHGSFGIVFMAKDLEENKTVAIKCITKKTSSSEVDSSTTTEDDNSEELRYHAQLGSHPNIVNLIHSFETETHIYLVLEFCSRGDLYEAIRTGTGPLQTDHVRQFMLQLVNAVEYIHRRGLYHRDIKPENIFIAHSGEVKLGDFGLATTKKWTYEVTVGSDRYMAPEQFDSAGAGYSPEKADIWAIGICLLNVLFSRNPFTAPTESDPLFLDFSRDMQSLFDVFPTMSQDTFEVILQCMSLDPRKRCLDGVRKALERLVSFTTVDETYDDFLMAERRGIASANREPIRTPSIQSPQIELSSFDWTKALNKKLPQKQQIRVPIDDDNYSEELFPKSDEENHDWFSDGQQSPSLKSVLDSTFENTSVPLAIHSPRISSPSKAISAPHSSSLPTFLRSVFWNKDDAISKSWSDLWEEEEQEEAENQVNSSKLDYTSKWNFDNDIKMGARFEQSLHEKASDSSLNYSHDLAAQENSFDIDQDLPADGFFFYNVQQRQRCPKSNSYHFSPSNTRPFDKWSALGERRRAHTGPSLSKNEFGTSRVCRELESLKLNPAIPANTARDFKTTGNKETGHKIKGKECPWLMNRAWNHQSAKANRQVDSGDLEWVGCWKEPHL